MQEFNYLCIFRSRICRVWCRLQRNCQNTQTVGNLENLSSSPKNSTASYKGLKSLVHLLYKKYHWATCLVNCLGKSVTILAFFQTKCPLLLESWLKKLPHKFHYWRKKKLSESLSFQGCYYFQIQFYVLEKLWTRKYAVVLHHQRLYSKHMNVKLMLIQLNEPNVLKTIWCGSRYKLSWWSIRRENLNNPIEEIIAIFNSGK